MRDQIKGAGDYCCKLYTELYTGWFSTYYIRRWSNVYLENIFNMNANHANTKSYLESPTEQNDLTFACHHHDSSIHKLFKMFTLKHAIRHRLWRANIYLRKDQITVSFLFFTYIFRQRKITVKDEWMNILYFLHFLKILSTHIIYNMWCRI